MRRQRVRPDEVGRGDDGALVLGAVGAEGTHDEVVAFEHQARDEEQDAEGREPTGREHDHVVEVAVGHIVSRELGGDLFCLRLIADHDRAPVVEHRGLQDANCALPPPRIPGAHDQPRR